MSKITFIIGGMARGGAERVISILSNYYAEKGYATDIIVMLTNEVGYRLHETTKIIDFTGKTKSRIKRLPYWRNSIRRYLKENKPDVVVSFVASINLITLSACKNLDVKLIVSERNDPKLDGRSKIVDFLTKRAYKKANAVVFQTKRAAAHFPKLKNAVIIPNPILEMKNKEERNENKVVSVGRLMPQKNQKMLIGAFSKVLASHPDAFLEIYGEGELRQELQSQIDTLGINEKVKLMGNHENVLDLIKDAGVFCMSSNYEGLSNALLEAMTLGLPCISTDCAGADEYIVNGENGYLVPVADQEKMAEAISNLVGNKARQSQFSENVLESAKVFSFDSVMKKWDDVIL